MDEMSPQPITRALFTALTVALDGWINESYANDKGELFVPGSDIDFILNGLINFTANKVALVHMQLVNNDALEKGVDVQAFNNNMVEVYTSHFKRILINNMTGVSDERTSR